LSGVATAGHEDVVEWLIEQKADVNVQNDVRDTPLHMVCYSMAY
jgi:ankyrin repeat protein